MGADALPGGVLPRAAGRQIFGADAPGYHAARLGYSPALIDRVFAYAGIDDPRVVEIGPGTGLATRLLLDRGARELVAVEPDDALAAFLARSISDPGLRVLHSGFIEAPLQPARFDLAVAACSFHWIDPQSGLARLRDIVRPGGTVALWWHSYRNPRHDPFFAALAASLRGTTLPPSEGSAGHLYLDEARQRALLAAHGFDCIEFELYRVDRSLTAMEMQALYGSFSFVRLLPDDRRRRIIDHIGELVETRFAGCAPNVVLTPLYLAKTPERSLSRSS